MSDPQAMREMSSQELVETFEAEAGERWFGPNRTVHVSPPHPGIVPTWPRLIRERAEAEVLDAYIARLRAAVEGLPYTFRQHSCWDDHEGPDGKHLDGRPCPDKITSEYVARAAVLAAIEASREETP